MDYLLFRLVLAFVMTGGWVTLIALITAKYSGDLGGFVGGLPSAAAFSLLFTGWIESPTIAAQAATMFPLFVSFSGTFLLFFAHFARRGFAFGVLASLGLWFVVCLTVVFSGIEDFTFALAGSVLVSIVTYYGLRRLRLPILGITQKDYSLPQAALRFVLGGTIVVTAVLASQVGGPIFGGVFSAFPVIFISTLVGINTSHGTEISRRITMPLMVSMTLTVIPYGVAVKYLYPSLGVEYGTLIAYAVAGITGILYYHYGRSVLLQANPSP